MATSTASSDRNAARFVGMADQIGTLEPGKLADIILLSGHSTRSPLWY